MAVTLAQGFLVLLGLLQVVPLAITTGLPPTHPFAKIFPRSSNSVNGGQRASDPLSHVQGQAFSRQFRKLYTPRSVSGMFDLAVTNPPPRHQPSSIALDSIPNSNLLKTLLSRILGKGLEEGIFKFMGVLDDIYTITNMQAFANDTSTDHHLNPANHTATNATTTTTTQDPFSGSPDPHHTATNATTTTTTQDPFSGSPDPHLTSPQEEPTTTTQDLISGSPDPHLTSPQEEGTPDGPIAKEETQKTTLNGLRPDPDRKFPSYGRAGRYRRQATQSSGHGNDNENGGTIISPGTKLLNRIRDNFNLDKLSVKILTDQILNITFTSTSSLIYFMMNRLGVGHFLGTGEMVATMWAMYDATAIFVQWISADNTENNDR